MIPRPGSVLHLFVLCFKLSRRAPTKQSKFKQQRETKYSSRLRDGELELAVKVHQDLSGCSSRGPKAAFSLGSWESEPSEKH